MDSLKTKKEFDFVYRHGFCRYGKNFTLYAYYHAYKSSASSPNAAKLNTSRIMPHIATQISRAYHSDNSSRNNGLFLGLSISRKIGNAVVRNRLKRQIRMLCRELERFAHRFDLVFVARVGCASMSFAELRKSFYATLAFILRHFRITMPTPLHSAQSSTQADKLLQLTTPNAHAHTKIHANTRESYRNNTSDKARISHKNLKHKNHRKSDTQAQ